jgi:CBS-domain-containing membrane protein
LLDVLDKVYYRKQVSQFKLEQPHRLKALGLIANKIVDAIVSQQDVFQAAHNAHLPLMRTLHKETVTKIVDGRKATRCEILQELAFSTVRSPSY